MSETGKNMIRHIPNTLTLANLFCGCLGIVQVFEGRPEMASYLIVAAAVFDFFDGFAARLLNVASPIGKDLDSLADVVTFGVLPSVILFWFMEEGFRGGDYEPLRYTAFLVAVFSALRLAKFNNDPRQSDRFIGVPTPANAMLIASLPFISGDPAWAPLFSGNPWALLALTLVMSALLVAELPLLALKFRGFQWKGNQLRYLLIGISGLLLSFLGWMAIPLIMIVYLGLSLLGSRVADE